MIHAGKVSRRKPVSSDQGCFEPSDVAPNVPQASARSPLGHSISHVRVTTPQAKLAVSQPSDPLEQEAEHTAEQLMRMDSSEEVEEPAPETGVPGAPAVSRQVSTAKQAAGDGTSDGAGDEAESLVTSVLSGGGHPLDESTRAAMEPKFGHDFSRIRIHTDTQASQSADAIQAHAYATGNDIVFAQGKYAPGSADGQKLLAHELTHVVQQQAAPAIARSSIFVQRDGPTTAPAPPPTTTPATNPPPGAPPTADADKDLLDKEKASFEAVKSRTGYPGVEVLFSNPKSPNEKDNPVKEMFNIAEIVPRSTADGSRKGFDTAGAANAYAATIGTAQGVISIQQDNFFFVAKLAPGTHELRVIDRSWSTTDYIVNVIIPFSVSISDAAKRSYVYQVTPYNNVMGLAGADGYLFPLNTELDPNIDRTKYQSNPDTAKPPTAQALRDMVGIAPEGTKPEDRPKIPSQVDMTDAQKETFIYSYFRARGLEALQANEDQTDDLAKTFKATTPGTANADPKGVSPEAKAMIDSTRAQGEKFKQILDDEAQIGANLSFMKAKAEYGTTVTVTETDTGGNKQDYDKEVHDWDVSGTEDGKATIKKLSQWIALMEDKQSKVLLQKGEIMTQFPLLAQLVAPNTERYMPATDTNVAPGKDMYGRPLDPSVPQVYNNNPYKDSLLAKDATPENDEAIRAEFEKKLDAIRDAIRKTRAEVTGGDSDFLLGLGGLRLRVAADLDRMGDQNQGLKAKLDELLKAKAIKDQVVDIAGMAIQIGLLFVPGGQFLSAATGFAMAANEMNQGLKQWTASQASVTPGSSLADQQAAQDALFSATLQLAVSAIDVGVSVNHALGAIEAGRTPNDLKPQKVDEATEVPKKTTSGDPVKVPEKPVKLAPWEAENLRPQFVDHLKALGCDVQARTCAEATVLKESGNSWEGVKTALLRYSDANAAEKAAGEYFMNQMTVFRKAQDDALLKEAIDAIEAKNGISGMHTTEAVGSTSLTSDLDYSIKGPNAEEVIAEFNSRFRAKYGKESGVVFDTNAYTNPTYFEFPIAQDPTKPAKAIEMVPLDPAAKETTGGLEAWDKFKKDTLAGAKSPDEQKRLTQLLDEAASKYKNDLGARLRYVANYQQDVAAHIATCEHYLNEGAEGAAKWEEYKKDLLSKATGEQQEALNRVFAEAEARVHTYQNEVLAKLRELYPNEKFTEADLAEMAHSTDPDKLEKFMRARNRMYEEKLADLSDLKKRYAAATTEAEKEELAAQIQAKQQESLYFASEAYQTSGSILSVVQNTQKAGKAVLNPSYGALVASQSRAAFFEQYGKALAYDANLNGVIKAGKYTKRAGYAVMAHPLAGEVAMPGVMNAIDGLEGLKTASNDQVFQFLKGPYPSATSLDDALKMHHAAMAAARDQLAGKMIEISGRPLPDIQLAWEKLGEGDNTVGIMRLLSLLQQASALDDGGPD